MDAEKTLEETLERLRTEAGLPALAACAVVDGAARPAVVAGVRKWGAAQRALPTDAFQLGSDTKAMTATLIGLLVDDGALAWKATLGDLFPWTPEPWKRTGVDALLHHRSGLGEKLEPKNIWFNELYAWKSTERERWLRARLAEPPRKIEFVYSNANYAALGLIAETVTNRSWESLIRERLWKPLGIASGGFGAPPLVWQHRTAIGGKLAPVDPIENFDNPPIMAPAGAAYMSLTDWAKFVRLHLDEKSPVLLKPATLTYLHTAPPDGDYAGGWIVAKGQPWAGGDALTHTGSNTMNMAVAWLAPKKRLAVLVATNSAPKSAAKALNDAVLALIRTLV